MPRVWSQPQRRVFELSHSKRFEVKLEFVFQKGLQNWHEIVSSETFRSDVKPTCSVQNVFSGGSELCRSRLRPTGCWRFEACTVGGRGALAMQHHHLCCFISKWSRSTLQICQVSSQFPAVCLGKREELWPLQVLVGCRTLEMLSGCRFYCCKWKVMKSKASFWIKEIYGVLLPSSKKA